MDMTYDLNWVFSSLAQSAAAIVAIVGGFLTSYLLSHIAARHRLSEEIRRHSDLRRDYLNEHDRCREIARGLCKKLYLTRVRRIVLLGDEQLLSFSDGAPSVRALVTEYQCDLESLGLAGLYQDDLDWLSQEIGRLREQRGIELKGIVDDFIGGDSDVVGRLESRLGDLWGSDVAYMRKLLHTEEDTGRSPPTNAAKAWLDSLSTSVPLAQDDTDQTNRNNFVAQYKGEITAKREAMRKFRDEALMARRFAESSARLLEEPIPMKRVRQGFWSLGLLLVTSVLLPLALLPWQKTLDRPVWHYVVLLLFVVSLGVLGIYLTSMAKELANNSGTAGSPRSILSTGKEAQCDVDADKCP